MPAPIKRGSSDPQLQHWETTVSRTAGVNSTIAYKGIDVNKMSVLAAQYAAAGWDLKLRLEHDVASLDLTRAVAYTGGSAIPFSDINDRWEISVDSEKPELFENETFIQCASYLDAYYSIKISEQIFQCVRGIAASSAASYDDFWKSANSQIVKNTDGTDLIDSGTRKSIANMLNSIAIAAPTYYYKIYLFISDYLRGQTSFLRGKYVLRHTTNAPSDYAANVADFNVEKIYSISQLLSEAQSGTLWVFPLPGYLAYKILNYPIPNYMQENRMWGALKSRSNAVTAARGRVEISTEYFIDAWPKHTYGLAS